MAMTGETEKQILVGLEFLGLTHWDRYILNENIAKLERKLFPDSMLIDPDQDDNIWRGNRRRHYRLDTKLLNLEMKLEFRPLELHFVKAKVLNLSPAGCKLLMPFTCNVDKNTRIPKARLTFDEEDEITFRARVTHVSMLESCLPAEK